MQLMASLYVEFKGAGACGELPVHVKEVYFFPEYREFLKLNQFLISGEIQGSDG